jgi:uncharacterized FAD-dependent dehydrogenase
MGSEDMPQDVSIVLSPRQAADEGLIRDALLKTLGRNADWRGTYRIIRKSLDARRGRVKVDLKLRVFDPDEPVDTGAPRFEFRDVRHRPPAVIVGAGPAGLFAALRLIERGIKPLIVERGKPVGERKRDIARLNRGTWLDGDSNYAFGEGGAGTFSDGKLFSRSRKRADVARILHLLHQHGAKERILYDAHPHIGTNRLPAIIVRLRETILAWGGEFLFNTRVTGLMVRGGQVLGVISADGQKIEGQAVLLAAGHSAREIYRSLYAQKIAIEAKPFAMGVRVEHPQNLIDAIQYHGLARDEYLPAAAYQLSAQVNGRGVYSFCMCPGGIIVPAATASDEVVVNGMSNSLRDSPWANSGMVVEVRLEDLVGPGHLGPLAGLEFQQKLERLAAVHGGGSVTAPAQRLVDFVEGRVSADLPACSYHPGIRSSALHEWLPELIGKRLQEGFRAFGRRMKGFLTNEALVVGVESRTSSPLRIPRDPTTLQHTQLSGLYPCGEGAGYAGGIMSSAMDGQRAAEALSTWLNR